MKNEKEKKTQIFEGIRILDFCQVIAGSYATTIMGDSGAEVIKVEPPVYGDALRMAGPMFNNESGFFLLNNRNKKSISIDLKNKKGVQIIKELIPYFDIFTENFRPGVMEKLGLGYKTVKKIKPDIIYVSVSGYGHNNDYSNRPAYDNIIQGDTGLASLNGNNNETPLRSPMSISDYTAGTYSAFAMSSAIYHHKNTGQGQFIDIAMYDSLISFMDNTFLICDLKKDEIKSGANLKDIGLKSTGNRHPGAAPHGFYKTNDGHIGHMSLTNKMWHKLLIIIGKEKYIEKTEYNMLDRRKELWKEIDKMIEQWTSLRTTKEVLKILNDNRLPCGKVRDVIEVNNDPHNKKRGVFKELLHPVAGKLKITNIPIKYSKTPTQILKPSPGLGEHNYEILINLLAYSKEQVDELIEKKVLYNAKKS